jgi:hypothetical protein
MSIIPKKDYTTITGGDIRWHQDNLVAATN